MAKGHRQRAGSRAYWPKKRAKRIYPKLKHAVSDRPVPLGFAGYKAGMSQVKYTDEKKGSATQGQDILKPVTIIEIPSLFVCGIKLYKSTPQGLRESGTLWSEKLSKDLSRKIRPPKEHKSMVEKVEKGLDRVHDIRLLVHTKPWESGFGKKKPELFELPLGGDVPGKWEYAKSKLGSELKASDVFEEGEFVDASAVSKGKGFQGPVKRFGVKIRPRKHEKKRRHVGVIGPRNVARVLPGKIAMAGQLGFQSRTEHNKRVLKIGSVSEGDVNPRGGFVNYGLVKSDYMLLEGSVPGPRKRLIMLRKGLRTGEKRPVSVKGIYLESQQGN